jgi:hypothetical protein
MAHLGLTGHHPCRHLPASRVGTMCWGIRVTASRPGTQSLKPHPCCLSRRLPAIAVSFAAALGPVCEQEQETLCSCRHQQSRQCENASTETEAWCCCCCCCCCCCLLLSFVCATPADIEPGQGLFYASLTQTYRARNCETNSYGARTRFYGLVPYPCRWVCHRLVVGLAAITQLSANCGLASAYGGVVSYK